MLDLHWFTHQPKMLNQTLATWCVNLETKAAVSIR